MHPMLHVQNIEGVDFKGRNGYATLHSIKAFDYTHETKYRIEFWSKRVGDAPPAVLEGDPDELRFLLHRIMSAIPATTRRDRTALDDIQAMMSGVEWSADTLDRIAQVLRQTGREIEEVDDAA